ncbi:MAG: hypothetical protein KDK12_19895 [Rhodobacteraceae bacterium]|nr:hypothetical protein [Paracoccaceae bacterium]
MARQGWQFPAQPAILRRQGDGGRMLGAMGYILGIAAAVAGLSGAGLRLWPRPGWSRPRFLTLALALYALQLFVWSLVHRGDAASMARDRDTQDARARGLLRRLGHGSVDALDEVQALAAAYWLFVAGLGAVLIVIETARDLLTR